MDNNGLDTSLNTREKQDTGKKPYTPPTLTPLQNHSPQGKFSSTTEGHTPEGQGIGAS